MSETANTPAPAAPATETPATPPAEAPKADSSKYLELAKREADFAKREVARKEEYAKVQSEYAKAQEELKTFRSIRETYRDNPVAALKNLGLTYEELTEAVIAFHEKGETPEKVDINKVREEIQKEMSAKEAQRLAEEQAAVLESFQNEINDFLASNTEKYPFVTTLHKSLGETESAQELIYGIIDAHFNETNEILDFATAANAAEEHFREEWEKLNGKLTPKQKEEIKEAAAAATTTPTTEQPKTENKVEEGTKQEINNKSFSVKIRETPTTITNKMFRPKAVREYDPKSAQRKDAIQRGVEAYEAALRNKK